MHRTFLSMMAGLLLWLGGAMAWAAEAPVKAEPTAGEKRMGVDVAMTLGAWRWREGRLETQEAAATFGGERWRSRFWYATQTPVPGWTLGMRLVDATRKETGADGEVREGLVPPVMYLQGPEPGRPGNTEEYLRWTGREWRREQARVLPDGTLKVYLIGDALTNKGDKLHLKWRGQNLTFDHRHTRVLWALLETRREALRAPEQRKAPEMFQPPPR